MDTINTIQKFQSYEGINPLDVIYNFIISYILSWEVLVTILVFLSVMETIKYFSEGTKYGFEMNKKLYGGLSMALILIIDYGYGIFNGIEVWSFKFLVIKAFTIMFPVFALYNIILKQIAEGIRTRLYKKIEEFKNK
ncbi:MAG: hypothetical protein WC358_00195 [Ignavibacteria bacterium]|jgi:hypothetical protein